MKYVQYKGVPVTIPDDVTMHIDLTQSLVDSDNHKDLSMKDISREDVLDILNAIDSDRISNDTSYTKSTIDNFKDLVLSNYDKVKSREWIPTSEKLPSVPGLYEVTKSYRNKIFRVDKDFFYNTNNFAYDNAEKSRKVVAWRPQDDPYIINDKDK